MSVELGRESLDAPVTPKVATEHSSTPQKAVSGAPPVQDVEMRARMDKVLQSDIGINTLLTRLKQSISSAREFSGFLRERASLEEKHYNGISRLTRNTHDLLGRPDSRQGSFAFNYREMGVIHEKMARNSEDFAQNLFAMSDELQRVAEQCERGRKHWKHTGLEAEQRAQDAESSMEKAKQRYFSLAEQYDRVRTGERQGGKFGLKGPKSAAQQEESLFGKAEAADHEYRSRVEAAQAQRHELFTSSRPEATRELHNLIMECDAAVSMQLQKFAVMNEKLLLGNGLCISPLKNQETGNASGSRSLRDVAHAINSHGDFEDYVLGHSGRVGPTPGEIRYEKHPALMPVQHHVQPPTAASFNPPTRSDTGFRSISGPQNQNSPYNQGGSYNQSGQTSGVVSNYPPPQQGSFPNPNDGHSPNNAQRAPQLPQIGGLSMNNRHSLERERMAPGDGRGAMDYRNNNSPLQQRPGQPSSSEPLAQSPSSTTHARVTSYDTMGPGVGRGQPPVPSGPVSAGPPMQGPYRQGSRGPSLGQPSDFRSDARGPSYGPDFPEQLPRDPRNVQPGPNISSQPSNGRLQQGPNIQSQTPDGRLHQGPNYSPHSPDGRLHQGPNFSPHSPDGRPQQGAGYRPQHSDGPLPQGPDYRPQPPNGRGQPLPSYQDRQTDPRGLPSQTTNYGPPVTGVLANNKQNLVGGPQTSGRGALGRSNLPPSRPVFGVSLDELFRRDGAAVPAIVYQCIQAVDLFGMNVEGVYRISGSAQHIMELQAQFDHDASQVDFRSPAAFFNDIASVTTLLKHFLRDLPDPLLTSAQYKSFIGAARIEEDIVRRDQLHAIINSLPDPNYATLRTLVLHLSRIAQNSAQNRMTTSNLAVVFGPTLMGGHGGGLSGEIEDAGWQARVIETILNNTFQIFDDDD